MPRYNFDDEVDAFDPTRGIEDSHTPPDTWYTDPDFYEQEVARIFQRSWIAVGRTDQVEKPGHYFTGEIAGNPYVVVRAKDGCLHAHHNVCRHKGAIVAREADSSQHSCKFFQCPYHGWEYRHDGGLKRAPHLGLQQNFLVERYGLRPIAVETWGPFVFLDLDGPLGGRGNPRPLHADIAPLKPFLEAAGFEQLRCARALSRSYIMNCNWKLFVDNGLDGGYHVAYAHEGLADELQMSKFETHIFDRTSIQVCATKGEDRRLGDQVMYAYVFPNLFINRYGNMMDVNLVEPLAVDKCRVRFDFYFDYENFELWESKKKMRQSVASSHLIQQEDIDVCESAQTGMRSMTWRHGRYSSTLERAVYAFHVLLWHELKGLAK